ncbi:MAG: alpha-amylase family glycosyl hydrolase [Candidatus Ozemobacteraceae bacterium]
MKIRVVSVSRKPFGWAFSQKFGCIFLAALWAVICTSLHAVPEKNPTREKTESGFSREKSWAGDVLYFILIDRFYDGIRCNNYDVNLRDPAGFHGGDLEGIIQKLDYLQDLGVSGLWLSPTVRNRPNRFFSHQPYHGYWAWDFFSVDPRFGTLPKLQELVDRLHKRKMKVLLDLVVNHMGYDAPFVAEHPEMFHETGNIKDWNNPREVETGRLFGLPDFASESGIVKSFFQTVAKFWIQEVHPDGFRLDAVKHVPTEFWRHFNSHVRSHAASDFLLLGELMDGNPENMVNTMRKGEFSSLFDYPLYYTLLDVIARHGDCGQLALRLYQDFRYPDPSMLATFLDNHDTDRFVTSCGGSIETFRLALAFLLTARGIPVLCYGDEIGLPGALEPANANRGDMRFTSESDVFAFTKKLIGLRRTHDALKKGVQVTLFADSSTFSFCRITPNNQAIAILRTATEPAEVKIPLWASLPEGTVLTDALGGSQARVISGALVTSFPGPGFHLYLASALTTGAFHEAYQRASDMGRRPDALGRIPVTFEVSGCSASDSASVHVIGGLPDLGDWKTDRLAPSLKKQGMGSFRGEFLLPARAVFEAKLLVREADGTIRWQEGGNRLFQLPVNGRVHVVIPWRH